MSDHTLETRTGLRESRAQQRPRGAGSDGKTCEGQKPRELAAGYGLAIVGQDEKSPPFDEFSKNLIVCQPAYWGGAAEVITSKDKLGRLGFAFEQRIQNGHHEQRDERR